MRRRSWTCPYCNRPCTLGSADVTWFVAQAPVLERVYYSHLEAIVCPNEECQKMTMTFRVSVDRGTGVPRKVLHTWHLLPESQAKPFPDYIPEALRSDYAEACLIKTKSPKASATLCRRCLDGMIRDFWGIEKDTLSREIAALEGKVAPDTWEAIDAVRQSGNIGAHMEKDVNLIIDTDPGEADRLLSLIETLFQDWYVARHEHEERMRKLAEPPAQEKPATELPATTGKAGRSDSGSDA